MKILKKFNLFIFDERNYGKSLIKKGDWVIAFDAGNGWYKQMTKENSYKLII